MPPSTHDTHAQNTHAQNTHAQNTHANNTQSTLKNRTVLITGSISGIGYATALGLARLGAHVVLTGRNAESAQAAVARMKEQLLAYPAADVGSVQVILGDLTTKASVIALADTYRSQHAHLDILINNAGLMPNQRTLTADGLESGFAVNVMAPLLLTQQLLPILSEQSRIITLTGGSHPARIDLQNLQAERTLGPDGSSSSFVGLTHYSHNKIVMMAMMRVLAERLAPKTCTVNVCYPGQAATAMTQSVSARDMPWLMRPFAPLFRLLVRDDGGRSAEKASRASVYLASNPQFATKTGTYINTKCQEVPWPAAVDDPTVRQQIWNAALRAAGITDESIALF